jgi:hypothetical protein
MVVVVVVVVMVVVVVFYYVRLHCLSSHTLLWIDCTKFYVFSI